MTKYIAIGHFKESENIVSVALTARSIKDMKEQCAGNTFVAWAVFSEKKVEMMKNLNSFDLYEEVKKSTTSYRRWNVVTDYVNQCMDIMEEKLARIN